ncbi:MAG: ATP-binding protein [Thermoplasmatales archaeon]|nr:ATP-binding protein [Thermoplasmatales archaeon]
MKKYIPRIIDSVLETRLRRSGAVLIKGPKWCGKTTTASMRSKSILNLQNPKMREKYLETAATDPLSLLDGDKPRLLDEWQIAPNLWDAVRQAVDSIGKPGQFILTGSSVPPLEKGMHSGAGRISELLMRTMSLYESGDSNGRVSLGKLFEGRGEPITSPSGLGLEDVAFCTVRGGWPFALTLSADDATKIAGDYLETIVNRNISEIDGVTRSPARVWKVIRSLARNTSTPATLETIRKDMSGDGIPVSTKTISEYLGALERLYVTENLEAWSPALRSRTVMRATPKRHFTDPSIACAALSASPEDLLQDRNTFGFLFESLCVRDLRVYADALEGNVFHYRDKNNLEVDAVVHLRNGKWGAVEIKLSPRGVDDAAENLKRFSEKINHERMREPSFLMVLTVDDLAYRRQDGVYVVPIGCLGP